MRAVTALPGQTRPGAQQPLSAAPPPQAGSRRDAAWARSWRGRAAASPQGEAWAQPPGAMPLTPRLPSGTPPPARFAGSRPRRPGRPPAGAAPSRPRGSSAQRGAAAILCRGDVAQRPPPSQMAPPARPGAHRLVDAMSAPGRSGAWSQAAAQRCPLCSAAGGRGQPARYGPRQGTHRGGGLGDRAAAGLRQPGGAGGYPRGLLTALRRSKWSILPVGSSKEMQQGWKALLLPPLFTQLLGTLLLRALSRCGKVLW